MSKAWPGLPQIACFDTAFHRTIPWAGRAFALPKAVTDRGIQRYGFHGLSYQSIADRLPDVAGEKAGGRIVVAHLGNGASLCALRDRKSVATTMGLTPLDGLVMGNRPGQLDPGAVLYLFEELGMSAFDVRRMLFAESGLLGVSGISNDMRTLLDRVDKEAKRAVDLFVYRAVRGDRRHGGGAGRSRRHRVHRRGSASMPPRCELASAPAWNGSAQHSMPTRTGAMRPASPPRTQRSTCSSCRRTKRASSPAKPGGSVPERVDSPVYRYSCPPPFERRIPLD